MSGTDATLKAGLACPECFGTGIGLVSEGPGVNPSHDTEEKCWRCDGTGILPRTWAELEFSKEEKT